MKYTTARSPRIRRNTPFTTLLVLLIVLASIATVVVAQSTSYRIFLIGDSTVCDYPEDEYPFTGWGQLFSHFFKNGAVTVNNRAIGGRSTKKFYVEGRWAEVVKELSTGDFVFIQFGHNDRDYTKEDRYADTNTYKSYLRLYANESRAKGAIPVFVTPMNMNTWNGSTVRRVFTEFDRGADYCGAMKNVAKELNVPVIDLEAKSAKFMASVGKPYLDSYHHMGLQPGEYPNYPDGYTDVTTHFQEMGSIINARMVAEGIKELATHTDVGKLAEVLAPLNKVTVTPNKANTGLVTVSGDFPAGVTITVKVMPNSGETFLNWADGTVSDVSSKKLYTFTMPDAPVTMHALFKGGATVATAEKILNRQYSPLPRLTLQKQANTLLLVSTAPIRSVELFDLDGRSVAPGCTPDKSTVSLPLRSIGKGVRIVKVCTSAGTVVQTIGIP
jgi:lysophospholipase L1-like esterase